MEYVTPNGANRQEFLIALGSNSAPGKGDVAQTIAAAVQSVANSGGMIRSVSRFFATPCYPPGAGPDFVNAAMVLRDSRSPAEVLEMLHRIEASFGRERRQRWGPRTLDLDLLGAGDTVLPDVATQAEWCALPPADQRISVPDRLILPHPRMQDRAFVLVPLCDIAADWQHPTLGRTARQLRDALPEPARAQIVAL